MRTSGTVLTVIGSALVVAGMITMVNSMDEDVLWDDSTDSQMTSGAVCTITGYATLGAGIPLWIVGAVKHKKYSAQTPAAWCEN